MASVGFCKISEALALTQGVNVYHQSESSPTSILKSLVLDIVRLIFLDKVVASARVNAVHCNNEFCSTFVATREDQSAVGRKYC